MFPDGWPGRALLLLRLVAGILLIHDGVAALLGTSRLQTIVMQSVAVGAGTLLLGGLWTPIAGVLVIAVEIVFAFSGNSPSREFYPLSNFGRQRWRLWDPAFVPSMPGFLEGSALTFVTARVVFVPLKLYPQLSPSSDANGPPSRVVRNSELGHHQPEKLGIAND